MDKLRDLYIILIANDKTEKENIEVKTIWRWIKNLVSQMRNYSELIRKNNHLKLYERHARSKERGVKRYILNFEFIQYLYILISRFL